MDNWDKVKEAFNLVKAGVAKRIDGEGFIVYRVGNVIRIDFKPGA